MLLFLGVLCLVTALTSQVQANTEQPLRPFFGLSIGQYSQENTTKLADSNEQYFDQLLDHSSDKKTTFKQRYFVNTNYGKSSGVHFLYIEGENPLTGTKVTDETVPHVTLAKTYKATVWALEHRFYGTSRPFKKSSNDNLQLLTSQQAVEDIATFIQAQNTASKEKNPQWVVFGGSYAGALVLWFQRKYPNLSAGVVASSPLVVPTLDSHQYQKNVEDAYYAYNPECWEGIKYAALEVRNEIQYTEGLDRLNAALQLTPQIDDLRAEYKTYETLHHIILTVLEVPVLFNRINVGPFANGGDISDVCTILANETLSDSQKLYQVVNYLFTLVYGKFDGFDTSYDHTVKYLSDSNDSNDFDKSSTRNYFWQKCNEFGQFITTDHGRGLFSATVPNDYHIGLCQDVFGKTVNVDYIQSGIQNTRTSYNASENYDGTNAIITVGGLDPWRTYSVKSVSSDSSTLFVADGAGHCADFYPPTSTEPSSVGDARKVVSDGIKKFLNPKKSSKAEKVDEKKIVVEDSQETIPTIKNWNTKIVSHKPKLDQKIALNLNKTRHASKKEKEMYKNLLEKMHGTTFTKKNRHNMAQTNKINNATKLEYLKVEYVLQDLDHFDHSIDFQFYQRFLSNPHYQRNASGPRFLILGGESGINWQYVDDYFQYVTWAKDFDAALYALEHRYFGESYPIIDAHDDYLRYLNVEQAMADIAVFIKAINARDNIQNPKWFIFGGSYAGNLVALFRLRYPELSVGAVASSAPLQPKVDFYQYMQRVERDIKAYGREGCSGAIRRYFAWYRKKFLTRVGRKQIVIINYLCNDWNENYIEEKDAELLLADYVFELDSVLQYDNENHDYLDSMCKWYKQFDDKQGADKLVAAQNIHKNLRYLQSRPDPKTLKDMTTTALAKPKKSIGKKLDHNDSDDDDDSQATRSSDSGSGSDEEYFCYWYCSYNQLLQGLQTIHNWEYYRNTRMWMWMTCNEWGFAESTNFGNNIFESSLPINHIIELCIDVFGEKFDRESMHAGVLNTLKKYGGQDNYNGTNVVLVNGSEDPWSTLGVTTPVDSSATAITIDGTSHCEDMYREKKNDVKVLKAARKQIKTILEGWIKN